MFNWEQRHHYGVLASRLRSSSANIRMAWTFFPVRTWIPDLSLRLPMLCENKVIPFFHQHNTNKKKSYYDKSCFGSREHRMSVLGGATLRLIRFIHGY